MPEAEDEIVCTAQPVTNDMLDRFRNHLTLSHDPTVDLDALIALMPDPLAMQDCTNVDIVNVGLVPDGAQYFAPKLPPNYLNAAIKHLQDVNAANQFDGGIALLSEFAAMFQDPTHPNFIDFKRWGTSGGPVGSISGGSIAYVSETTGTAVAAPAFEPFGNYFFGLAGALGGISPATLRTGAGLVSQGTSWPFDDPQDMPHVERGIADAQRYANNETTAPVVEIIPWYC